MKGRTSKIIQVLLSIAVLLVFHFFFFKVLGLFKINTSGSNYVIFNFIKHLLEVIIIAAINHSEIKKGQNKFSKTLLNSIIYAVACFVFLIVITILLHKLLNYIGNGQGISVPYNFTNYFKGHFTLSFALNLIIECLFVPFLLCMIFPLGFSKLFSKSWTASLMCGLVYGIFYGILLNTTFEIALFMSITPATVMILLTYLYKTNQNIWAVVITYACYVLFGIFAINYIV